MLFVVGLGHRVAGQVTTESLNCIQQADKVLYTSYLISEDWLKQLNPNCESLNDGYQLGKDRRITYEEWVERILFYVRQGLKVCVAFYGHPGVCVDAGHEAIRRARREGFRAQMLPGISALDVLIADLGVDPTDGSQTYEATDFLIRNRNLDTSTPVILWQIGIVGIGDGLGSDEKCNPEGVQLLAEVLATLYSPDHEVTVYEASPYPVCDPLIQQIPIGRLTEARISAGSTLYIPPKRTAELNREMLARVRALEERRLKA